VQRDFVQRARQSADQWTTMNPRVATIKQLVADGAYPIDEAAIADAIVVRSMARRLLPDVAFRVVPRKPVRSFRHHRGARSFRLARAERRPTDPRMTAVLATRSAA
jgi:hypothetical protein